MTALLQHFSTFTCCKLCRPEQLLEGYFIVDIYTYFKSSVTSPSIDQCDSISFQHKSFPHHPTSFMVSELLVVHITNSKTADFYYIL